MTGAHLVVRFDHIRFNHFLVTLRGCIGRLVCLAGLWLVYRFVIYPYLLYSTDYYKTEFHHRHRLRQKAKKPFTGREIGEWAKKRDLA